MPSPSPLDAEALRHRIDPDSLGFDDTSELAPLDESLGQTRAVSSIEHALRVRRPHAHLFVTGAIGSGRNTVVPRCARVLAETRPTPDDIVCVHDFATPDRPRVFRLPPGRARVLKEEMDELVETLSKSIPRALSSRAYRTEYQQIIDDAVDERRAAYEKLDSKARGNRLAVEDNDQSLQMIALDEEGKPLGPERFDALPADERQTYLEAERSLRSDVLRYLDVVQRTQDKGDKRISRLDEKTVRRVIRDPIERVIRRFRGLPDALAWLREVRQNVVDTFHTFSGTLETDSRMPSEPFATPERYEVNILVDHAETEGAPVVTEWSPTYHRILGSLERRLAFGALETNHTMVRAGSLLQASGGILVINAGSLVESPFAWRGLKRALLNQLCAIEEPEEFAPSVGKIDLHPEPIPIDVRVVLIGSLDDFLAFRHLDEDFARLFKLRADFQNTALLTDELLDGFARYVAARSQSDGLLPFSADAVAALAEEASRMAGRRDHLSLNLSRLADRVHEADAVAGADDSHIVLREHVRRAGRERRYRSGLFRDNAYDYIADGTIVIELDGERVGQVNALAVIGLDEDSEYGVPFRITAKTFAGSTGVVNIDRETELSGQIHSKAVLILGGFLGAQYAQRNPLALGASITFEQNYGPIDGDSASIAEAVALLSSLADLPVRQDLAITGSMSQHGETQAVGGINEKIEGFFDVCAARGLTGTQGVIIPASNKVGLQLASRVCEAVARDDFAVYAAEHVDDVLELMTGVAAGKRRKDGTFAARSVHGRAMKRLAQMREHSDGGDE